MTEEEILRLVHTSLANEYEFDDYIIKLATDSRFRLSQISKMKTRYLLQREIKSARRIA
jgi:hypothetical protein